MPPAIVRELLMDKKGGCADLFEQSSENSANYTGTWPSVIGFLRILSCPRVFVANRRRNILGGG